MPDDVRLVTIHQAVFHHVHVHVADWIGIYFTAHQQCLRTNLLLEVSDRSIVFDARRDHLLKPEHVRRLRLPNEHLQQVQAVPVTEVAVRQYLRVRSDGFPHGMNNLNIAPSSRLRVHPATTPAGLDLELSPPGVKPLFGLLGDHRRTFFGDGQVTEVKGRVIGIYTVTLLAAKQVYARNAQHPANQIVGEDAHPALAPECAFRLLCRARDAASGYL